MKRFNIQIIVRKVRNFFLFFVFLDVILYSDES